MARREQGHGKKGRKLRRSRRPAQRTLEAMVRALDLSLGETEANTEFKPNDMI